MSRARVVPVQAPQFRQYALISDFLDLAHLSFREEAALATTWIKDRPEGLKLQNLAFGHHDAPGVEQFTSKSDYRRPVRHKQMRVFAPRATFDPSWENPSVLARDFHPHMAVLRGWRFRHLCGQR